MSGLPSYNAFMTKQSECIDWSLEDRDAWEQYMEFTHPKHRSLRNNITRPINFIDVDVPKPTPEVLDTSILNMNLNILRNNEVVDEIGYN